MPSRHLQPSWLLILILNVLLQPELHVPVVFKILECMAICQDACENFACEHLRQITNYCKSSKKGMNLTLVLPIFSSSTHASAALYLLINPLSERQRK